MTDLIAAPNDDVVVAENAASAEIAERPLQWAPREEEPKKHRTGLWVGIGLGVLLLGAGAVSTVLIAPGTTIGGVSVGGLTPGAAAEAIAAHVATTEVTLTGGDGDVTLTGADLGATVDAKALADEAFASRPMWNLGSWMSEPIAAEVTLDSATADAALRDSVPTGFVDATDATVAFDAASGTYVTTPAKAGSGIDSAALGAALSATIDDGDSSLTFSGDPAEVPAAISDDEAGTTANTLNTMLGSIGFYVGEERAVPIDAATAASWITVTAEDGALSIQADSTAIQSAVDALPGEVNRAAVNGSAIVNSAGTIIKEIVAGVTGRELGDTSDVASSFASQIGDGNGVYALSVNETPFETATVYRHIEVNLSEQRTYLYEGDTVVSSYAISSGLSGTPTPTGNFTVFAHSSLTDMGCYEGAPYCTEDVPWSTWFAPDIAFHGAYWHNNFGTPMSHGCVNMPVDIAKYVYDWAPVGTEVWVHA